MEKGMPAGFFMLSNSNSCAQLTVRPTKTKLRVWGKESFNARIK